MSTNVHSFVSLSNENPSENQLNPPNRQHSNRQIGISDLSHQLEATSMYCMESEMGGFHVALRNGQSVSSCDNGNSGSGSNNHLSRSMRSSDVSHPMQENEPSEEIDSEEEYIRDFAKRCAEFPGRKPVLLDIQNSIPHQQRSQFSIILV